MAAAEQTRWQRLASDSDALALVGALGARLAVGGGVVSAGQALHAERAADDVRDLPEPNQKACAAKRRSRAGLGFRPSGNSGIRKYSTAPNVFTANETHEAKYQVRTAITMNEM